MKFPTFSSCTTEDTVNGLLSQAGVADARFTTHFAVRFVNSKKKHEGS